MGWVSSFLSCCASFASATSPESAAQESLVIRSLFLLPLSAELPLACGRAGYFSCWPKRSNQENPPPAARSPGILPCEFARVLRGSLDVRPCTFSERAHIVCALLRTDPAHPRRATGAPFGRHPAAEASASLLLEVVQGCTDSWIQGAVRGAEHRRRRRKMPAGARAMIAAFADSTRMYCQTTPPSPRSAGTPRRA